MDEIRVAVMNTSKEITDLLREILENEGMKATAHYTYLFRGHEEDFEEYISVNTPDVIVYDIAIPYKENYELLKKLSQLPTAKNIPFVLTTTNKAALEKFVGETKTYELIGKPYDLDEIVGAVKKAYESKHNQPPAAHSTRKS